jgi:hypothetical protein
VRKPRLLVVVLVLLVAGAAVVWTLSLRDATAQTAFVGQADQICGDYHDSIAALGRPGVMADVPGWAARERPFARTLTAQLTLVVPPRKRARDYARFLALVRRQLALLDAESTAAQGAHEAEFERVSAESHRVHAQQAKLAKRLGFLLCGR